ncbi:uncharacterized protein LOC113306194 [Papaver somniferum]|uniref:uncharacterized protein LOC113306194 n=1 Tax=Papaver somniferum TaxID=3469 RepID=UPI000E6F5392|nr:uncharacterized protein LOC113306194 [Papaver somniferum]
MSKKQSREEKIDRLHQSAGSPFKLNIREFRPPMNFIVPKLPEFNEKTDDPDQHVLHYETAMTLWQHSDELMCKMFPQSLDGGAIKWFNKLHAHSIGIRKEESIRKFTRRFKQELAYVDGASNQIVIEAYKQAYQYEQRGVYGSLVKRPPNTLEGLYDRVEEYARVEDDSKAREMRHVNRSSNHPNDGRKDNSKNRSSGHHNDRGEERGKNQGERMKTEFQKYHDMKMTPLNIQLTEFYEKIIKDLSLPCPLPAETRDKRDNNKYCKFHKDHGHKTEKFRALQIKVHRMIDARNIQEYVKKDFGKGPGQFGTTHMINAHVINVSHARIHSMTRRASKDESGRKLR